MLMRQFEGSIAAPGSRGNGGLKTSITGWGGIECLKFSWQEACMIVS